MNEIDLYENSQLRRSKFKWMLNLVRGNMAEHYEKVGWNFDDKYEEISTTEYFLIIENIGRWVRRVLIFFCRYFIVWNRKIFTDFR